MNFTKAVTWVVKMFRPPPADTARLRAALHRLRTLARSTQQGKVNTMTTSEPSDLVSISQAELNTFAQTIESAVGVLGPYLQQLAAGQSVQLQPADESAVQQALSDLQNLEPPVAS